jgi:MPBQ/MSBQ methyltransferase
MRFVQHKAEARWFYAVVSQVYDRWVNPLFWTAPMRDASLQLAGLGPGIDVVDVGAGTGFTTQGIVAAGADPARVTMVDQSPHQLAKARRKADLGVVAKVEGDAERLPLPDGVFDRWVSAGSIEYWPDPAAAFREAFRVLRPGGTAVCVGPLRRTHPLARALSDAWMLFPPQADYERWMREAGFTDVRSVHVAPEWWREGWDPYAISIAGTRPEGDPPLVDLAGVLARVESPRERLGPVRLARFALGSLAGAAFIPVALFFSVTRRLRRT